MNAKSLLALEVSGFWLPCTASAEVTIQPVALYGQPAPGLSNNVTFAGFSYVSLLPGSTSGLTPG